MSSLRFAALVLAGLGGGLSGSIAGLASLVTYPALLGAGLAPITANVTNTVALVFNSLGSVSASGRELAEQRATMTRLIPVAAASGAAGAGVLLLTPSRTFAYVVPVLIGVAAVSVLLPVRGASAEALPAEGPPAAGTGPTRLGVRFIAAVAGIGWYGGYFGAAAGVLMLALFLAVRHESFPRANAAKNLLLGVANLVAATLFVVLGNVDWGAFLPLALGLLAGGRLGPPIVRRVPAAPLRAAIGLAGLVLAVRLGVQTWQG